MLILGYTTTKFSLRYSLRFDWASRKVTENLIFLLLKLFWYGMISLYGFSYWLFIKLWLRLVSLRFFRLFLLSTLLRWHGSNYLRRLLRSLKLFWNHIREHYYYIKRFLWVFLLCFLQILAFEQLLFLFESLLSLLLLNWQNFALLVWLLSNSLLLLPFCAVCVGWWALLTLYFAHSIAYCRGTLKMLVFENWTWFSFIELVCKRVFIGSWIRGFSTSL